MLLNESFGSYLKQLRKNKGLSLHDVYEETGITDSRLSKLERNQVTDPTVSAICKLSMLYNVNVVELLDRAGMNIYDTLPLKNTSLLKEDELEAIQNIISVMTKGRRNIQ